MAKSKSSSPNLFGMLERVLIASMNRGQAPLFVVACIVCLMLFKMPGEDVSKLAFKLVEDFEHGYFVGYGISIFTTFGWFFHAKYQRQTIVGEMQRIANERNRLQEGQTIHEIESSEE